MRVHPVVVEEVREGETIVYGDEGHHLARVLRVRPGDAVRAFDGSGRQARGTVRDVERGRVTLELRAPEPADAEPAVALTVAVALLKGTKLADVVRMGTELGASRFVLLTTRRAEPDDLSPAKLARLERVAREAAKQSGRAVIPAIDGPVALEGLPLAGRTLIADPGAPQGVAEHVWAHRAEVSAWTTVTGPEGGFEDAEVDALTQRGAVPVSLGRSILRAETAPVVLAAAVLLAADGA